MTNTKPTGEEQLNNRDLKELFAIISKSFPIDGGSVALGLTKKVLDWHEREVTEVRKELVDFYENLPQLREDNHD